jgi:hypothetical protein
MNNTLGQAMVIIKIWDNLKFKKEERIRIKNNGGKKHSSLHEEKFKKLKYTKNFYFIQSCSAVESYGETYCSGRYMNNLPSK